ncbi:NUMOD3 domain-containing DNA-binding protein [Candidatus Pacearchaeota archaeon]|jgi:hypothetical protein|nr:NUMOD3 domain-containing DNA-binding protein [Candidatus Pacearchaeota archaeon]
MRKGQYCSEETKAKMSIAQSGEKNHMWGKHQSPEANAKRSASLKLNNPRKGRPLSAEHRAKLSAARMGKPPWNKGKIGEMSEETRAKISQSLVGRKIPLEIRDKISKTLTGKYVREKNVNWRGGKDSTYCPKFNESLRKRIRAFFEYRCVTCGKSTSENVPARQLSCHHVEYNKAACCDGEPVHFAALCHRCHTRTTNGNRTQWEAMIHRIIDEIWNGKSYFTKEEWKEYRGVNK